MLVRCIVYSLVPVCVCVCLASWRMCCVAPSILSLSFNAFDFCTLKDGLGMRWVQMSTAKRKSAYKHVDRRWCKDDIQSPGTTCQGNVLCSQFDCIIKLTFTFPFTAAPITIRHEIWLNFFSLFLFQYFLAMWHYIIHEPVHSFAPCISLGITPCSLFM